MNDKLLLAIKNLKKNFPIKGGFFSRQRGTIFAVRNISFNLNRNTSLGLVGESGSGKTTVAKCLVRLTEPTGGIIEFCGKDVSKLDRKQLKHFRRDVQMIFQDPYSSLNPRMTVAEIVGEGLKIHKIVKGSERKDRVTELLRGVGFMPEYMKRNPHEFSGGQRQRIGIARALALKPKLIVADEPVSALDVSIQAQVINLLMRLQKEYELSYIIIAHDLAVVTHMCHQIAVMYLGKIVEIAEKDVFCSSPLHPYSIALLSAVPIPDPGAKDNLIVLRGEIPSPQMPPSGCVFHTRCPKKKKDCGFVEPLLTKIDEKHFVACHFIKK